MSIEYEDIPTRPLYGATIYHGRSIIARFDRAEDAISCLPAISRILHCELRLETHVNRTTCRVPDGVVLYDSEFHYRP